MASKAFDIKEREGVPSTGMEGRRVIFMVPRGSGAAGANVSCVGEDLPDNEVDLLFSEFLHERASILTEQSLLVIEYYITSLDGVTYTLGLAQIPHYKACDEARISGTTG